MLKKAIVTLVALAGIVMGGTASASTWTAYTYIPSDTMATAQNFQKILTAIETATDHEIKFRLRLGGSLPIQVSNITQAVGNGTIMFADDGFFLGNVKVAGILRLPFLLKTPEEYQRAAAVLKPYIDSEFAKQGVLVLGQYIYAHQTFYSAKKLENTDDIKGQKIRVTSPEQAEVIKHYSGVPISMGTPEVAPALQSGVVDGALTASAGGAKIWHELLKYNYRLPVNYFNGLYIVNKAGFEKLDPKVQQKMRNIVSELAPSTSARLLNEEDALTDSFRKEGMVVTLPADADIDKAIAMFTPYWEQWAQQQGSETVEALQNVRAALNR